MNIITISNILIIVCLLGFVISGYRKGFVLKLLSILSFFVLGFLAWQLSGGIANYISIYPRQQVPLAGTIVEDTLYATLNHIFIFVILFVVLQIALFVLRPMLRICNNIPVVSTLNRMAGGILGGIQGLLLLILVSLLLQLPFFEKGNQIVHESYLRYYENITNIALFYVKEPIMQLQVLGNDMDATEAFTQEEVDHIKTWLLQQNINKENVDEILAHLRVE